MAEVIQPFAMALILCDYVFGYEGGKTDIYGLFNAIRPASYPHVQERFCVFAQLVGGFGEVPFRVEVLFRARDQLVRVTEVRQLHFSSRETLVQLVWEIQGCTFAEPGPYLIELYGNNVCVADVPLLLLGGETNHGQESTP